jgi:hypothetical protein
VENEDLMRLAQWFWDRGGEGMVLKDASAPYVRGPAADLAQGEATLRADMRLSGAAQGWRCGARRYQGRKLRVAVPPPLRGNRYVDGQAVDVEAMEWTDTGQLRQGRIVENGSEAKEAAD